MSLLKLLINGVGIILLIVFLSLWGANDTHTSFDVLLVIGTVTLSASNILSRLFSKPDWLRILFQLSGLTGFILAILGAVNVDVQPVSQNLKVVFYTTISLTAFNILFPLSPRDLKLRK